MFPQLVDIVLFIVNQKLFGGKDNEVYINNTYRTEKLPEMHLDVWSHV